MPPVRQPSSVGRRKIGIWRTRPCRCAPARRRWRGWRNFGNPLAIGVPVEGKIDRDAGKHLFLFKTVEMPAQDAVTHRLVKSRVTGKRAKIGSPVCPPFRMDLRFFIRVDIRHQLDAGFHGSGVGPANLSSDPLDIILAMDRACSFSGKQRTGFIDQAGVLRGVILSTIEQGRSRALTQADSSSRHGPRYRPEARPPASVHYRGYCRSRGLSPAGHWPRAGVAGPRDRRRCCARHHPQLAGNDRIIKVQPPGIIKIVSTFRHCDRDRVNRVQRDERFGGTASFDQSAKRCGRTIRQEVGALVPVYFSR